jgi:hypothetical protein
MLVWIQCLPVCKGYGLQYIIPTPRQPLPLVGARFVDCPDVSLLYYADQDITMIQEKCNLQWFAT